MVKKHQAPNWQPLSALPLIANMIDEALASAEQVHKDLQQAQPRGDRVMDDFTVGRVAEVYSTQLDDLWLYEEQVSHWKKAKPSPAQKEELKRLTGQLGRLRNVLTSLLALADEMKEVTIEKILAKDDAELAIEVLSGKLAL